MKMVFALALAATVTAPAFAQTIHHNTRRGLRAYAYTTHAPANTEVPANTNPNAMRWSNDKAGGGSMGYNQHNEVSN